MADDKCKQRKTHYFSKQENGFMHLIRRKDYVISITPGVHSFSTNIRKACTSSNPAYHAGHWYYKSLPYYYFIITIITIIIIIIIIIIVIIVMVYVINSEYQVGIG